MASPQVEDGFTRIATELLEAFCHLRLRGGEAQVLLAIVRKTYGWQKKEDWISGSQLVKLTGLPERTIYHALRSLKRRNIIRRFEGITSINKDYTSWTEHALPKVAHLPKVAVCTAKSGSSPLPDMAETIDTSTIDKRKDSCFASVFNAYEQARGGLVSPLDVDQLADLEKTYSAEWVVAAIEDGNKTRNSNMLRIAYIEAILARWKRDGFRAPFKQRMATRTDPNVTIVDPGGAI